MSPELEAVKPVVAVIMGSSSDWETMQHAVDVLERFGVSYEKHIVSAHRTPVWMAEFAIGAEARAYAARLRDLPSMKSWYQAALAETWRDAEHEQEVRAFGTWIQDLRAV